VEGPRVGFPRKLSRICGADASYRGGEVRSAAVLSVDGVIADRHTYRGRFTLPYVRGLFYLHEGPFVVRAIEGVRPRPQLLCLDAHGEAHPRSAGLAKTVGIVSQIPSIGIAKSLLVGVAREREGGFGEIEERGRSIGFVTGSRRDRRYWSPGYSVTMWRLAKIIRAYREDCLRCLAEAHRVASGWPTQG